MILTNHIIPYSQFKHWELNIHALSGAVFLTGMLYSAIGTPTLGALILIYKVKYKCEHRYKMTYRYFNALST